MELPRIPSLDLAMTYTRIAYLQARANDDVLDLTDPKPGSLAERIKRAQEGTHATGR